MAFGALENVLSAITSGKIDCYDILLLKDANGKPYIGWVDKDNQPVILQDEKEISVVTELPDVGETGKIYIDGTDGYFWNGTEFVNLCNPTDVSVLETELANLKSAIESLETEVAKKADVETVRATYEAIKYEITGVPEGTLINYFEHEIRVMCPANTVWTKQNVGTNGDANSYYMTFKTLAPSDEAVGYIEHLGDQVDAEILKDIKTDENGCRYQPTWLALAKYDEATGTWTYRGDASTVDKLIGYDYRIDWYNADGVMIASDSIRINLTNEDCHSNTVPFYVSNMASTTLSEANQYTDFKIAEVTSGYEIVEF